MKKTALPLIIVAIIVSLLFSTQVTVAEPLKLVSITPSGEDVASARQITFEFDRNMVPLGKMERIAAEIPITISPEPGCEWRWLNLTTLACQLSEKNALRRSTHYTVTVSASFKSFDGSTLESDIIQSFITERPNITSYWFDKWQGPGSPVISVSFNQPVSISSVEKRLRFSDAQDNYYEVSARKPKEGYPNQLLIESSDSLPLDSKIRLEITPGLISEEGDAPGIEQRSIVEFATFPEFKFLGIGCTTIHSQELLLGAESAESALDKCDPLEPVNLRFSAPVLKEALKDNLIVTPDLKNERTDFEPWDGVYTYSQLRSPHEMGRNYEVQLPSVIKATEYYTLFGKASEITDEFGRELRTPIEFSFKTDNRKPRYHLDYQLSVLEKGVDSELPIIVTNLGSVNLEYSKRTAAEFSPKLRSTTKIEPVMNVAYAIPFGIRNLLGGGSGVVWGKLTPRSAISDVSPSSSGSTQFVSQVTPFHVHAKLGHFNSLVWVTDFASGEVVPNANVEIYSDLLLNPSAEIAPLAQATTDKYGAASLPGLEQIDPKLVFNDQWDRAKPILFAKVTRGNDLALLPISYDFRAWASGAYSWKRPKYGHLKAWGTTAQGIYRLGDTLEYKIYVRHQNAQRFIAAPQKSYELVVYDPLDVELVRKKNITLNRFGAISDSFPIPKNGAVGWYRFELIPSFTEEKWEPLRVLVSDFTPAPFRVSSELNKESYLGDERVVVRSEAKLHAGGPFADAHTRVTATITRNTFTATDPALNEFTFWHEDDSAYQSQLFQKEDGLDRKGELEQSFKINAPAVEYGSISVESAVQDDRGKFVAGRDSAKYFGRDRFVGIRQSDWILEQNKTASLELIVLDPNQQIITDWPITATVEYEEITASRVKGAGNAYLTNYVRAWKEISKCEVHSESSAVTCQFTPEQPGQYRIKAEILDSEGKQHWAQQQRWASGKGWIVWDNSQDTELKILPEKRTVAVGDTARFMIQNPFPGARALVTLERYGIQKSWVETFPDSSHILEVPITADQIPGFYLSVVVMSPRVDKPLELNGPDLGKPSFRMGYVEMTVEDPAKRLRVEVTPRATQYKPRETVTIDIAATTQAGKVPEMEFAVTVLDQSVFDLLSGGKAQFDPYQGFYALDSLDVENYNILKMLIGRQKFEKKGANAGGDGAGGKIDMRSLFKFVSYWNPSVKPDKKGKATITFPVPDNLTGWQIFVMAVTKDDLMGLGEAEFKVNKPTELRPALPNQMLEGDRAQAKFTVMNRTDQLRTIEIKGEASGSALAEKVALQKSIEVEPFKREVVSFNLETKQSGEISFVLTAKDGLDSDGLTLTLPVRKAYVVNHAATFGSLDEKSSSVKLPVEFPSDIHPDIGGLALLASASMLPSLEGAFQYMKEYPYLCWEQILTKGVIASQYLKLKAFTGPNFEWDEAKKIAHETLERAGQFQAPSGGMTYYVPRDEYVSPYLSAYTALAFSWMRQLGYVVPEKVEERLLSYLDELLKRDTMPDFYTKGMASTVRAVALAALASRSGKLTKDDIARYEPHLNEMTLFGKAHYLNAALKRGTQSQQKLAVDKIMSFSDQSSGKLGFVEAIDPSFERIHDSTLRSNCAVMSALLSMQRKDPAMKLGELPVSLARTISQTIAAPHGEMNTQELMFCLNALIDYQRSYEVTEPTVDFSVNLDGGVFGSGKFKSFTDKPLRFDRPMRPIDPGSKGELELRRSGKGRLYYSAQINYSSKTLPSTSTNSGVDISREYSVERNGTWEKLTSPFKIKVGELIKVDLFISLPAARNFLVVDDPIPGGLEPVNRELATSSQIDAAKAEDFFSSDSIWHTRSNWWFFGSSLWAFYHKELRHDFARFYSEYLEAGDYHLSYTAQAIAPGEFTVLPAKAAEMYNENVYGLWFAEKLQVKE